MKWIYGWLALIGLALLFNYGAHRKCVALLTVSAGLICLCSGCAHGLRVNGGPVILRGECRIVKSVWHFPDATDRPMDLTFCVTG